MGLIRIGLQWVELDYFEGENSYKICKDNSTRYCTDYYYFDGDYDWSAHEAFDIDFKQCRVIIEYPEDGGGQNTCHPGDPSWPECMQVWKGKLPPIRGNKIPIDPKNKII